MFARECAYKCTQKLLTFCWLWTEADFAFHVDRVWTIGEPEHQPERKSKPGLCRGHLRSRDIQHADQIIVAAW